MVASAPAATRRHATSANPLLQFHPLVESDDNILELKVFMLRSRSALSTMLSLFHRDPALRSISRTGAPLILLRGGRCQQRRSRNHARVLPEKRSFQVGSA